MIVAALMLVLAGTQETELRSTLEPVRADAPVRVGDPVRWTLEAIDSSLAGSDEAPELADPALLKEGASIGLGWAILDGPRAVPVGSAGLHLEWTLLPLESGVVRTPAITVRFADGREGSIPEASLDVTPALGPDEDQARPLPGFRDVEERPVRDPRLALLVVLLLIVGPVVAYALWIRRGDARQRSDGDLAPSPEAQIAALAAALEAAPNVATGAAFSAAASPGPSLGAVLGQLGPLARQAIDTRDGLHRSGLTDDEWASAVAAAEAGSRRSEAAVRLGRVVAESSAVRFSGLEPTSYAVREALAGVRAALDCWNGDGQTTERSTAEGVEA